MTPFADGGGAGLPSPAAAKAAVKCQAAIKKAGLKFGRIGFKATQKCADAAATCVQVKFNDASCLAKPSAKCQADFAKLQSFDGPLGKLIVAASKKCPTADLALADIGSTAGLGFAAPAVTARCAQFTLTPADPVTTAIERVGSQHLCEGAQMLERHVPRVREFGRDLDIPLVTGG